MTAYTWRPVPFYDIELFDKNSRPYDLSKLYKRTCCHHEQLPMPAHKCKMCDKKFRNVAALQQHLVESKSCTTAGPRLYKCPFCTVVFTRPDNCERHQIKKHKEAFEAAKAHATAEFKAKLKAEEEAQAVANAEANARAQAELEAEAERNRAKTLQESKVLNKHKNKPPQTPAIFQIKRRFAKKPRTTIEDNRTETRANDEKERDGAKPQAENTVSTVIQPSGELQIDQNNLRDTEGVNNSDLHPIINETKWFLFGDRKIRKTSDTPQRVSVYDLISAITEQELNNARITFARLTESYGEVITKCSYFKFPGQGQRPTPVIDAQGVVLIINLLSGSKAAQFRLACADVIVRYLGGDETLIAEIKRNQTQQELADEANPISLFKETVTPAVQFNETNPVEIRSVTNLVDLRAPQNYMRQVFGRWSNVHPVGRPQDVLSAEQLAQYAVIKNGSQGENTGRQLTHTANFSRSKLLDSSLTSSYSHVEMKAKDIWINNGELYEGLHESKTIRDTELLLVKDQADYERQLSIVQGLCKAIDDFPLELKLAQEKTKQVEAEARKAEAEAEARKAEAFSRQRALELEIDMLRLRFEMQKFEVSTTHLEAH